MSRPTYRSWSQLSSYEKCPEEFYHERIAKVYQAPAVWFPAGTAYHSACEAFDLAAFVSSVDEAVDAGGWGVTFLGEFEAELDAVREIEPDESAWRTAKSPLVAWKQTGENADWWRDRGPAMVEKYVEWRRQKAKLYRILQLPDGKPALETEMLTYFGSVQVKAFADLVLEDINTGATVVVDRKSGKRPPKNLDQLGVYRLGLEDTFKVPMWYGAWFMARTGTLTHPRPLEQYDDGSLQRRFEEMDALVTAGHFLPVTQFLCDYCGVRPHCSAWKEQD